MVYDRVSNPFAIDGDLDENIDGLIDAGELFTLGELGIESINTTGPQLTEVSTEEVLLMNLLNQLVSTMASISAGEPADFASLTVQQRDDFSTAVAAAWQ